MTSITLNLLSILLSIAMMLTGASGLETDVPMASVLTVSDIYFEYNDTSFKLDPSATVGVMTDNGTAVFDLSMQCGEKSLFPMQLVVTEEAATLVVEKTGQAFTIDAETLNALVEEALDVDFEALAADEEFNQALDALNQSYGSAFDLASTQIDADAINAKVAGMLTPVETGTGVASYNDVEYQVIINRYVLDNDQMFELIEAVYDSSEELSAMYDELIATLNETMAMDAEEGEAVPEITSMKDLYDMIGVTMSLDLTEYVTEDGAFSQAIGALTMNYAELPEPMVMDIKSIAVEGTTETVVECVYGLGEMQMAIGVSVSGGEDGEFFEMICEVLPMGDELAEEDYADAFNFVVTGGNAPAEDGGANYGFSMEISTYDAGFAFLVSGAEDEEGDHAITVDFEFADEEDTIAGGLALNFSKAVFANAAEGLATIAVDPENMEALESEFSNTAMSLMVDLQTLIEDESVTNMIAAFTAIIDETAYETVEVEAVEAAENPAEITEVVVEAPAPDAGAENTEAAFEAPEFTYIPEGLTLEEPEIDPEYSSASYTISDESYDNVYYVYVYADPYGADTVNYALGEDGAMTEIAERVINIETEEDAIYAETWDKGYSIGISYYGTDLGLDEMGKILAGMTY